MQKNHFPRIFEVSIGLIGGGVASVEIPPLRSRYFTQGLKISHVGTMGQYNCGSFSLFLKLGHDDRFQVKIYRMSNEYENFRSHITPQMGYHWKGLGKRIKNISTLWGLGPLPGVPEAEQYF